LEEAQIDYTLGPSPPTNSGKERFARKLLKMKDSCWSLLLGGGASLKYTYNIHGRY